MMRTNVNMTISTKIDMILVDLNSRNFFKIVMAGRYSRCGTGGRNSSVGSRFYHLELRLEERSTTQCLDRPEGAQWGNVSRLRPVCFAALELG